MNLIVDEEVVGVCFFALVLCCCWRGSIEFLLQEESERGGAHDTPSFWLSLRIFFFFLREEETSTTTSQQQELSTSKWDRTRAAKE